WSIKEKSIAYNLLVFLQPPAGHSFSIERDTTQQLSGRPSNIRVLLECTCRKKQLLGGGVCLLHDSKAPRGQHSFLLQNLCTSSCLDMEKVTLWVRLLVKSAWQFLPESHHCQLMVLPSSLTCKFQLTGITEVDFFTEMFFVVDKDKMENQQCKHP
ncbi:IPIL1 protein, partial [Pedionomus torquatus]|nr:IPIL1 protein [Pedionomus torquatus]